MKLVAIIKNSIVASISLVADNHLEAALAQEGARVLPFGSPVQIGWLTDDDGLTFYPPAPPPPPPFVSLADPGRDRQRDLTSLSLAIAKQDQPATNDLFLKLLKDQP
jgi:hypothetical protein